MNSVQENKNELEAAVRYCESAISRANATIESMEFRQQAATKAWHEQTGREEALQREVAELKVQLVEREDKWDDAMNENRQLRNQVGELKSTCAVLEERIDEMKDSAFGDANTISHLKERYEDAKTNMALLTDEVEGYAKKYNELAQQEDGQDVAELKKENAHLLKSNAAMRQSNARLLNKQQEMEQTMQLQKDQIAMFQRKMSRLNEVDR